MTVKELKEELSKYSDELEVFYTFYATPTYDRSVIKGVNNCDTHIVLYAKE